MRRLLIGIGVLVVVAVGALVIFSLAGGNGEDDPAETTLPPVETGDLVEADAVVVPVRSADLSLPSAGTVAELLVAVGEQVDAGQVLVRLDAEQEAAALAEAGAALASWNRKPQECEGDYFFSGRAVMTHGVADALSPEELFFIVVDLKRAVEEHEGLDYLQVYTCDDGRRVWVIDQLSRSMKEGKDYTPAEITEYDVFTLLLPEEY